jgi:serine/threonine-protein kinase
MSCTWTILAMNELVSVLTALLDDQRRRWGQGERVLVENYLHEQPALRDQLRDQRGAVLDLIYNEILLREQAGETPRLEEYCARFPEFAEALAIQFEVDGALNAELANEPANSQTMRDPLFAASATPAAPPAVPNYDVLEVLGRGGAGVVYKARHLGLNRLVALKMILAGVHADADDLARFRREAAAMARLQHPNIVQVYDHGMHDGRPFIALEYVDGSLSQSLAGTPLPPRQAAQWLETLARAIDYGHQQGVLHRDLKPSNVLLSRAGALKIADFGMAKILATPSTSQTQSGMILGTPCYMAPEQAEGRSSAIGYATDVYGLGAILYEMLTGRPPFDAPTVQETLDQVRLQEPVLPSRVRADIPRDLETICLHCLHKDPGRRYATAGELAQDLSAYLAGEPIRSRRAGPGERLVASARRHPVIALLAAGIMAGVAGLAVGMMWSNALVSAAVALLSLLIAAGWYAVRQQKTLDELRRQQVLAERLAERLRLVLEMTPRLMRTTQLDALLRLLAESTVWLARAEFATIYLVDHNRRELRSRVTVDPGVGEIVLPLGVGIAGTVALQGEPINIPDAYADPRFDQSVDRRTGHRTRNLLTMPLKGQDGHTLGVFQVINKQVGSFGVDDVETLAALAASATVAIERTLRTDAAG